ncbi:MAG: carotenoid 1,2-hydratase [Gammaproteobacteria bacterium]|nr:carotenoid 1,2-hydratase [Gammaproteobacteria bacterium]
MLRRRWARLWLGLLGLGLAGLPAWSPPAPPVAPDNIARVLREDASNAGFTRVLGPRAFAFPRDHAAHPDYRHEWWYVTGHLEASDGTRQGFQLTFFRYALSPRAVASASRWRAQQVLLAHFALTDEVSVRFIHHERRARVALGLAGASDTVGQIWLHDWRLEQTGAAGGWHLQASAPDATLTLDLQPRKPVVPQGEQGYSRKSATPGNASFYYSLPRLAVTGTLQRGDRRVSVHGTAWLDHEWGTSALGASQAGWDWFALQLHDGRELSFYRLREVAGSADPHSRGVLVHPRGEARPLDLAALQMTPLRWWRSPVTGIRYPVAWRVVCAAEGLDLRLEAVLDAQEWPGSLRYWEGAVRVSDYASPTQNRGAGYLELTGYTR